jgi:hypothetical protein
LLEENGLSIPDIAGAHNRRMLHLRALMQKFSKNA